MNVFCCHSSTDKDIVKPLAAAMLADNHDVFLDEWSLVPGDSLVERIPNAIAGAGVFVFFLSKASVNSAWCRKELAIAVSQMLKSGRMRAFAYRLERVDPPLVIDDMLYIDAVSLGYDDSVERLRKAVLGKPAAVDVNAYQDIAVEHLNVQLHGDVLPAPFFAALRLRAKRFQNVHVEESNPFAEVTERSARVDHEA